MRNKRVLTITAVLAAGMCICWGATSFANPPNTAATQTPPDGLPATERVAPLQADYSFEALLVFPAVQPPDVVRRLVEDNGGMILSGLENQTFWCLFPAGTSLDAFENDGVIVVTAETSDEVVRSIAEPTAAALAQEFLLATGPGGRQAHAADDSEHPLINDAWDAGGGPRDGNTNEMTGTTTVAVIFVESNGVIDPDTYTWTTAAENAILANVSSALSWWAARAAERGCTASFPNIVAYRGTTNPRVQQGYEPILHPSAVAQLWVSEIMGMFGYLSGNHLARVSAFNTELRGIYGTDRAYTAFVAYNPYPAPDRFTDDFAAWAYLGGPYTHLLYRSFNWPFAQVFAHETGHIYWACDEYYQAGYGGCTSCGHCRNGVDNGNCEYCNPSAVACMMRANTWNLCSYTPGHLGWTTLGACCDANGSCAVTLQAACTGNWRGVCTTCSPNPCPPPQGACCYADGSCNVMTQAACTGTWRGAGWTCDPNPCATWYDTRPAWDAARIAAGYNQLRGTEDYEESILGPGQGDLVYGALQTGVPNLPYFPVGLVGHPGLTVQSNMDWTGRTFPNPGGPLLVVSAGFIYPVNLVTAVSDFVVSAYMYDSHDVIFEPGDIVHAAGFAPITAVQGEMMVRAFGLDNVLLAERRIPMADWTGAYFVGVVSPIMIGRINMYTLTGGSAWEGLDNLSTYVPAPTGACCTLSGGCTVTTQANCTGSALWQGAGTTCTPNPCPPLGDLNGDGVVEGRDIQGWVDCALGGGTNCARGDFDDNGVVDVNDIPGFIAALLP